MVISVPAPANSYLAVRGATHGVSVASPAREFINIYINKTYIYI